MNKRADTITLTISMVPDGYLFENLGTGHYRVADEYLDALIELSQEGRMWPYQINGVEDQSFDEFRDNVHKVHIGLASKKWRKKWGN